jgi:hypothetical protein
LILLSVSVSGLTGGEIASASRQWVGEHELIIPTMGVSISG